MKEIEPRGLPNKERVLSLFENDVYKDWNKIKEVIEPLFKEVTGRELDFKVNLVSSKEFKKRYPDLYFGASGIAMADETTVVLPSRGGNRALVGFYSLIFHELKHLVDSDQTNQPFENLFVKERIFTSLDTVPSQVDDLFKFCEWLNPEKAKIIDNFWWFSRLRVESKAEAFSLYFSDKLFKEVLAYHKEVIKGFREDFLSAAEMYGEKAYSGLEFERLILLGIFLVEGQNNYSSTLKVLESLDDRETATRALKAIKAGGALAIVDQINTNFSKVHSSRRHKMDYIWNGDDEEIRRIGDPGHKITEILTTVAQTSTEEYDEATRYFLREENKDLLIALMDKDLDTACDLLLSNTYLAGDKLIFAVANQLESQKPVLSVKLYQRLIKEYPRSNWTFKAQHRI